MLAITTPAGRLPFDAYLTAGSEAGLRWSLMPRSVLHLLWSAAEPLGAYQAAERLSTPARRVHPTSVYRGLRALVDAGLVVPIVTWKKYLISPDPGTPRLWAALLCRSCRSCTLVEVAGGRAELERRSRRRGFAPRLCSAECEGTCRTCAGEGRLAHFEEGR
jgi:Fur family zinc uptake transcriptional regulator